MVHTVARKTKETMKGQDIVISIQHRRTLSTRLRLSSSAYSASLDVHKLGHHYSQARGIIKCTQSRAFNSKPLEIRSHLYSCYNRLPRVGHLQCKTRHIFTQPESANSYPSRHLKSVSQSSI